MPFYTGQSAECTGELCCCQELILDVCFADIILSLMWVMYIGFQVVSPAQPKGIKVSKDQDADKENKSDKVFIPFSAVPRFY